MEIIPQLVANSLVAAAIYILITLGFNLIYGATKFINMVHGVLAALGGYVVFYLSQLNDLNVFPSIILGVLSAGFLGYLSDRLVFRRLRKRKASNLVLFLASLGIFTLVQAVLAMIFSSQFQTLTKNPAIKQPYRFLGASITQIQFLIIVIALIALIGLIFLIKKTAFGKAVTAVSDDEEVARVVGINTDKIISYTFFIGSALAGLAGILIGFNVGIRPTMGLLVILEGATSSIIGGIGNLYGGVLGALLLGFVENFGIWKIASEWKPAIAFGLLVLFLIFRPQGIFKR